MLTAILKDPALGPEDRRLIRSAGVNGLTAADIAALVVYQVRLAQKWGRLGNTNRLEAKAVMVALAKAGTLAGAAVQLAQDDSGDIPKNLDVHIVDGDVVPDRGDKPLPAPEVIGDIIEVE